MADKTLNIKLLQKIAMESDWLTSTYEIQPREQVYAIVEETITVNNEQKTVNYIRSKINTSGSNKTFSELEYSDEYLSLQNTQFTTDITNLKNDISVAVEELEDTKSKVTTNTTNIGTLTTKVNKNVEDITGIQEELTTTTMTANTNKTLIAQLKTDLEAEIEAKIGSVYKPMGSIDSITDLPSLVESNLGQVYDVADAFITNSDFLEGEGISVPAGSNVAIIDDGKGSYKYDVIGSFVDLSNYYDKNAIDSKIDSINSDISSVNSNITSIEGDISTLQTNVTGQGTRLTNVEGVAEGLNTDIAALQVALGNKANSSDLNNYLSTTTASNTYLTKTDASNTYAKKTDLTGLGGAEIVLSATQPTGQKTNDLWFKILS